MSKHDIMLVYQVFIMSYTLCIPSLVEVLVFWLNGSISSNLKLPIPAIDHWLFLLTNIKFQMY